jgi:hypothetical protein
MRGYIAACLLAAAGAFHAATGIVFGQLPVATQIVDTGLSDNSGAAWPYNRSDIAGAALAPADPDPYAIQAQAVLTKFAEYSRRLNESRQAADDQYAKVKEQEAYLAWNYSQQKKDLKKLLKRSTDEAAQAESITLMERLDRLHYEQQGIVDRSTRYWEEQAAQEKERTRQVQAQIRLEQSLLNATALKESATVRQIKDITKAEKKNLDKWVEGSAEQVEAERAALYLDGRRAGMNQSDLVKILAEPMKEIAKQAAEGPPQAGVLAAT